MGYFPAEAPKVALIIVLDKPTGNYYGGAVAAPIFRNIVQRWLAISPYLSYLNREVNLNVDNDSVIIPDVTGFFSDDADRILKNYGLYINDLPKTRKIVFSQIPKPNSKAKVGDIIILNFYDRDNSQGLLDKNTSTHNSNNYEKVDKPDVTRLTLRRALAILHQSNIKVTVKGSGIVKSQVWSKDKYGNWECLVICNSNF